jgi:hypothetical protein
MAKSVIHLTSYALALSALYLLSACSSSTEPGEGAGPAEIVFAPASVDLGEERERSVNIENRGGSAVGPIQLTAAPVTTERGAPVAEAELRVLPSEIPTLNAGAARAITLSVEFSSAPQPGSYQTTLAAGSEGEAIETLAVTFVVSPAPPATPGATVSITAGPELPRRGDVVDYEAEVRDADGAVVGDPTIAWTIAPASAGLITANGRFVGYAAGSAQIIASAEGAADTLSINVQARGLSGGFGVVGRGPISTRFISDLWLHGDYAYTGTWSCRSGVCGNRLYVWDVSDPAFPTLTDSVEVDARVVNDVKIRSDGAIAVITHELSNDALNGITLLDLGDPGHPSVITRFTSGLNSGVHNVWVEGDYVYVVVDGVGNGLRILDISSPANPTVLASYYAGRSFLHDVYVRDGLAFLSHWDAGLVILDVGNGIAGGSPANPVEVSRIVTAGGEVHNAWYWPATGYVFVGEEDFATPGIMHVVNASDLQNPKEVATFRVSGATPHNFWLDEDRAILYAAWYERGLRALDVSGDLMGELDRQGREIASSEYGTGLGCVGTTGTCTWAPQLHRGLVYVSDMNTGLWALQADF